MTIKELRRNLRGSDPDAEVVVTTAEMDRKGRVKYLEDHEVTMAYYDDDRLSPDDPPIHYPPMFVIRFDEPQY